MIDSADYPRMLFHRSQEPVIVHSEEEEAALGAGWCRTILPPEPEPAPPIKPPLPVTPEPEEEDGPPDEPEEVPRPQIKPTRKPPARKTTKGRGQ